MGQCWSDSEGRSFWKRIFNRVTSSNAQSEATHLFTEVTSYSSPRHVQVSSSSKKRFGNEPSNKNSFLRTIGLRKSDKKYIRQTDEDSQNIFELTDVMTSSRGQDQQTSRQHLRCKVGARDQTDGRFTYIKLNPDGPRQPHLNQVAGIRTSGTCSTSSVLNSSHLLQSPKRHLKTRSHQEYCEQVPYTGSILILNPKNLTTWTGKRWQTRPRKSDSVRGPTPTTSIDLEWENEDANLTSSCQDVFANENASVDESSCAGSIARFGSRASSQTSIPGLDWDSQIDNNDLISLQNIEGYLDPEAEELITEIELLTSRALQETNQWTAVDNKDVEISQSANLSHNVSEDELQHRKNNNHEIWKITE